MRHTHHNLSSRPRTRLLTLALALVMGLVLACAAEVVVALGGGGAQAVAQEQPQAASELGELRLSWRRLDERHKQLAGAMGKLEGEHVQLTQSIEQIKRKGVTSFNRAQLRDLLRQGRKGAERLGVLQDQLREIEGEQGKIGARLISRLDAERDGLERRLLATPLAARAALVRQLNALSAERATYATRAAAPQVNRAKLDAILKLAAELDDPAHMRGMADELDDAEEKVRAELAQLDHQLDTLRARQRLLRRARGFAREERFFEESDRNRVVARVTRTTTTASSDRPNTATDGKTTEQGAQQGGGQPAEDSTNSTDELASGAQNNAASPPRTDSPGGFNSDNASPDPSPNTPTTTPTPPTNDRTSGGDPTLTHDTLIVTREADPATVSRSNAPAPVAIDAHIKQVEQERKALSKRAEALRARARTLRERATSAE